MATGEKVIVFNPDVCIGCRACQTACHVWNATRPEVTDFSPTFTNPPDLMPNVWTIMPYKEVGEGDGFDWLFLKRQCMHCSEAPCAKACPVGAIEVHPDGSVVVRDDRCIGCRYCVEACPYDVPRYDPVTNKVYKCTMCIDRTQNGLEPACVAACPTGALEYGDYDTLVSKYRSEGYEVYGDSVNDYVGHTHYVYVTKRWAGKLTDPNYFGEHLPANPQRPNIQFNKGVVRPVGWGLIGLTVIGLLGHLAFWRSKRMEEREEKK